MGVPLYITPTCITSLVHHFSYFNDIAMQSHKHNAQTCSADYSTTEHHP
jgi:hypothetical protein